MLWIRFYEFQYQQSLDCSIIQIRNGDDYEGYNSKRDIQLKSEYEWFLTDEFKELVGWCKKNVPHVSLANVKKKTPHISQVHVKKNVPDTIYRYYQLEVDRYQVLH